MIRIVNEWNTVVFDSKYFIVLGSRWYFESDLRTVQGIGQYFRTERLLGYGNRYRAVNVVSTAFKKNVGFYLYIHIQVA